MAKFIEPKLKSTHRDYIGQWPNNPINIERCTELISRDQSNGYGTYYPIIEFRGCGVMWYYGEKGHKIRDEQYQEILNLFKHP